MRDQKSKTILIISDHRFALYLMDSFDHSGRPAHYHSNVATVTNWITACISEYSAFVINITLPGIDGVALATLIRRLSRDVPIVILAENYDDELMATFRNAGANGYVAKTLKGLPVPLPEVYASIYRVINQTEAPVPRY